jgi:hypothetical protein
MSSIINAGISLGASKVRVKYSAIIPKLIFQAYLILDEPFPSYNAQYEAKILII